MPKRMKQSADRIPLDFVLLMIFGFGFILATMFWIAVG